MKINILKKLSLPELINHVWENDFSTKGFMLFRSDCDRFEVRISSHILDYVWDKNSKFASVNRGTTFTVEVEEELKLSTKIPLIVHMYIDSDGVERSENCYNQSIIECQFPTQSEEISLTMHSASGGDLTFIWNDSHGIPKSGVLKVRQR